MKDQDHTVTTSNNGVTLTQTITSGSYTPNVGINPYDTGIAIGGGGSLSPSTFTTDATIQWFGDPTVTTSPTFTTPCPHGHEIDETSIEIRGDEIWGNCLTCDVEILIPRITGGLNFEKAGLLVGRGMICEDGDDESIAELYVDLTELEEQALKEIARYERTLKLIRIARAIAGGHATKRLTAPIE